MSTYMKLNSGYGWYNLSSIGIYLTKENPIVELPEDLDRIIIIKSPDISQKDSVTTIRKEIDKGIKLEKIILLTEEEKEITVNFLLNEKKFKEEQEEKQRVETHNKYINEINSILSLSTEEINKQMDKRYTWTRSFGFLEDLLETELNKDNKRVEVLEIFRKRLSSLGGIEYDKSYIKDTSLLLSKDPECEIIKIDNKNLSSDLYTVTKPVPMYKDVNEQLEEFKGV